MEGVNSFYHSLGLCIQMCIVFLFLFLFSFTTLLSSFWGQVTFSSIQFSRSVMSDALQPLNCSTPGLPVHHQLLEFTQTNIRRVSDAIQLCHPLSFPSALAHNPSQHHSTFQWVNSSHKVAKVLELQLEHHSFQGNPRADFLQNGLVVSFFSPRKFQESSPTPQFKSIYSSVISFLYSPTLTSIHDYWKNHSLD